MKRSGFKPRTEPMARGTSTLKARAPMNRSAPPVRAVRPVSDDPKPKRKPSRGLKGRPPTAAEQRFMDLAGAVPCLACMKDGRINHHISLHHIDGRTKPGAHFLVLPLCPSHHQQDDTDPLQRISLHGAKKRFVERYGTEAELLAELVAMVAPGMQIAQHQKIDGN